jgi:diacylglycerol kinase (ATP)
LSQSPASASGQQLPVLGKTPGRVLAIVNPAAGQEQPILKVLNALFQKYRLDWDISITKTRGDAHRLTRQALRYGVELLIVNGGDGTVMECAAGLVGSDIPLLILPGGTANVMAHELGLPFDLKEGASLAVNPDAAIRPVDMGQMGSTYYMLRAGMGFEAAMVEGADRELKDRLGLLAYWISALQALADPPIARYRLDLDGELHETEGLACIIANSGHIGMRGLLLSPRVDISDGLLDVMVITRADLPALVSLLASVVGGGPEPPVLKHWQVRQARVEADPPRSVQVDGELLAKTPVTIRVVPAAVQVLVPPQKAALNRPSAPG